jgi:K+-sensing histidine kinase KdpD
MEESHNRLSAQYEEAKRLNEQLSATLAEKETLSGELRSLNVDLERRVAEQTASIRSANDSLQKTNFQLRESERMKELLTGALVHDIKNHLFSMTCDVHAIDGIAGVPGEATDILRHTASACSSAMSLAANMLDIGKMEEGKLVVEKSRVEFGALEAILDRYTGNALFRERQVTVQMEPPQFPLSFEADRYLLERVIQNLLTNAAMYTPKGGSVKISFAAPATMRVFNTGEPIPERYRKTLFEKYARVTIDSSKYAKGLGLFFCKLVMEAHGGSIVLECTEEGNCFALDFGE